MAWNNTDIRDIVEPKLWELSDKSIGEVNAINADSVHFHSDEESSSIFIEYNKTLLGDIKYKVSIEESFVKINVDFKDTIKANCVDKMIHLINTINSKKSSLSAFGYVDDYAQVKLEAEYHYSLWEIGESDFISLLEARLESTHYTILVIEQAYEYIREGFDVPTAYLLASRDINNKLERYADEYYTTEGFSFGDDE